MKQPPDASIGRTPADMPGSTSRLEHQSSSTPRHRHVAVRACALGLVVLAVAWINHRLGALQEAGYLAGIPAEIEVHEVVAFGVKNDFREGCGAAIFRVSDATLREIAASGLVFLERARTGRDGGKYFRYGEWQRSPASRNERVLRGLSCAEFEQDLVSEIGQAAGVSGSYFTIGYEYDLLLIPDKKMIVLTTNG